MEPTEPSSPSKLDQALAGVCRNCPVCQRARSRPDGWCNWFVRKVERFFCPACSAYGKVYGKPSHEPEQPGSETKNPGSSASSGKEN